METKRLVRKSIPSSREYIHTCIILHYIYKIHMEFIHNQISSIPFALEFYYVSYLLVNFKDTYSIYISNFTTFYLRLKLLFAQFNLKLKNTQHFV